MIFMGSYKNMSIIRIGYYENASILRKESLVRQVLYLYTYMLYSFVILWLYIILLEKFLLFVIFIIRYK